MELPIGGVLSGQKLKIALMQDAVVELIYDYVQPDAVLYGGTAIWRCYNGGRFSEDIDMYVSRSFESGFEANAGRHGIKVVWRDKELPLHMRLSDGNTEMLLEASLGDPESRISQYVRVDGSSIAISAMQPAELIVRKMEAYRGRRYMRDLYDIFHMTNYVDKADYYVLSKLRPFLEDIQKPVDAGTLASLIYRGRSRITFDEILEYLRGWSGEVCLSSMTVPPG